MQQYNYPTVIYYGDDALESLAVDIAEGSLSRLLLVTDTNLVKFGLVDQVLTELKGSGAEFVVFSEVHPNPTEDDVDHALAVYRSENCCGIIAVGGGSVMDCAKAVRLLTVHDGPLSLYDDAEGGERLVVNAMPPLYAVPTTAGTGSEVGRSAVIILRGKSCKSVIFSASLMPERAVLVPSLTKNLPPSITAATGIDAFTHALEAYLAPGFHPMADGIALEAIRLCLHNLEHCVKDGSDLEARGKMLLVSTMAATAFQKGLGMIHSLAHPLSAHHGVHHGLANALLLPCSLEFLENADLEYAQRERLETILQLFEKEGRALHSLSVSCRQWIGSLGIEFGLRHCGISKDRLEFLSGEAFRDNCHLTNMIPVTRDDLFRTYEGAF